VSAYWISWYGDPSKDAEFELHSPWWVSGYGADDETIYCAAVRAASPDEAKALVAAAYDHHDGVLRERFCEPLEGSPFTGRFPQAAWMAWNDESTCACQTCRHVTEPEADPDTVMVALSRETAMRASRWAADIDTTLAKVADACRAALEEDTPSLLTEPQPWEDIDCIPKARGEA
jgi:hypothetical protein